MHWLREMLTPKRVLIFIVIALFLAFFSRQLGTVLLPFIIAVSFAVILEPVIGFLERRLRFPRSIAVLATLVAVGGVTWYGIVIVVGQLVGQLIDLGSLLPVYRETITEMTEDLLGHLQALNESLPTIVSVNIQTSVQDFLVTLEESTKDLINRVLGMFSGLPSFLLVSIITLVATYFVSRDKDLIIDTFMQFVPPRSRTQALEFRKTLSVDLFGYIKGRFLMLIISTVITAVGLFLIGTRYWVLLAIVIGIIDQVPVVGPGIIFTPWVAMSVIMGDVNRAVYLTILYFVIFAVRNFAEPKIMGDSIGLHPLIMLLAMYGGAVFFGVLGLIIGPVLAIIVRATTAAGLLKIPPYADK
ncbi:MAG TPA: sporulation integral membrane protein YtvI [Firmicutes bacterium]|jgi:sporulation integral membrane protein YtvI|nr:sporulation integral membrane protein YtvI [Bacillota bacterium]